MVGELVDGTRATGKYAFRAGQPTPAPGSPAQNAAASASTLYEPAIDPVLLDMSLEEGRVSDEDLDQNAPKVTYSHLSTTYAPLTTLQDNTTVNTPKKTFYDREMETLISTVSRLFITRNTHTNKCQDDEATEMQPEKGKAQAVRVNKRSAAPTNTGNERRKIRRISAGQGMTTMATKMESRIDRLSDIIEGTAQRNSGSNDLDLETQAIEAIEKNECFDTDDLSYAVCVIAGHRARANAYLRMKDKEARTAYLLRMIKKEKLKEEE